MCLQQMRLIHNKPFTKQEVEQFRQLIFGNITHGLRTVIEAMEGFNLVVDEKNAVRLVCLEGRCPQADLPVLVLFRLRCRSALMRTR